MKKPLAILILALLLSSCIPNSLGLTPNLTGHWKGIYPCCGEETISIQQIGENAVATKITGDAYVPAGQITWRANVRTGVGETQGANSGYTNPRFSPSTLRIVNADYIEIRTPESSDKVLTFSRLK